MTNQVQRFDSRESETSETDYINWRLEHPDGFVVNIDKIQTDKDRYPKIHRVSDLSLSPLLNGNFTTEDYFKLCGTDLTELEQYCKSELIHPLQYCGNCMRAVAGMKA